jgi:hypothetical protein
MRTMSLEKRLIIGCPVSLKRLVMFVAMFISISAQYLSAQPCAHPAAWNTMTASQQTAWNAEHPTPCAPQPDQQPGLDTARAEIAAIKRVQAEQDRRIADLEAMLTKLAGQTGRVTTAPQSGTTPWKTPSNWDRIIYGMSQAQVVAILGQPTSVENLGAPLNYMTLFYRGEVPGSGFVSGNVKFTDDRVDYLGVHKPVF